MNPCYRKFFYAFKYFLYIYFIIYLINVMYSNLNHSINKVKVAPEHRAFTPLQSLLHNNKETSTIDLFTRIEDTFKSSVDNYYKVYYEYLKPKFTNSRYRFIINNKDESYFEAQCDEKPFLLIQIHSAPANIKKRLSIRYSWGNPNNRFNSGVFVLNNVTYKSVFVIGRSYSKQVNNALLYEASTYKDVVLTNFIDSYRFLTNKTMFFLKWANSVCLPKFMLKTDDDCYTNIPNIITYLQTRLTPYLYSGRVQWIMPANRDQESKFYVSHEEYKNLFLPPYVSGGGYLISGDLIPKLLNRSAYLPMIPNEDANIGILMHSLNITPVENTRMLPYIYCNESIWERPACDFVNPFVIHGVHDYGQLWMHYHVRLLTKVEGLCKQYAKSRHSLKIPLYCPTDNT